MRAVAAALIAALSFAVVVPRFFATAASKLGPVGDAGGLLLQVTATRRRDRRADAHHQGERRHRREHHAYLRESHRSVSFREISR